jgi:hypothetical protein
MAKLKESDSTEMTLGFRIPQPGTYNWICTEGIKLFKAEDREENLDNKKTVMLNIPCEIQSVARGVKNNKAEESEVGTSSQFSIVLIGKEGKPNERGEDQFCQFLTITKVMKRLMEKFPGDIDFTSQKFIDTLALGLPGKQFGAKHSIRKWNDREQINWEKVFEVKSAKDGVIHGKKEEEKSDGGDDW